MDWWFKPGDVVAAYSGQGREQFAVVTRVLKTRVVIDTGERYDHAGNHVCPHKTCRKHISKRWEAICEDADTLAPVGALDQSFVVVDGPGGDIQGIFETFQEAFAYYARTGRIDWYHHLYRDASGELRGARTRVADYA